MAFLTIVQFYNRKLNNKRVENHIPSKKMQKKKTNIGDDVCIGIRLNI